MPYKNHNSTPKLRRNPYHSQHFPSPIFSLLSLSKPLPSLMDALNFFKFWKNAAMATTSSAALPHLVVETDTDSDEEDSFFDLELTLHDFDNKENNTTSNKTEQNHAKTETKDPFKHSEVEVSAKSTLSVSPNEPISKRKVLPIEPISKPQSPIALLKSAPSFRIFTFRKNKRMETEGKSEDSLKTECGIGRNQKKEAKVFAVKLSLEEHWNISSPTLSRVNSTRGFGSKVRSNGSEEPKAERFSKEALQKYLKLLKPLYVKVSKRYGDKVKFSGDGTTVTASPSSSPSVASVSSRKERQGSFPAGMRGVSRHLGKSRSSPAAAAAVVGSPANRSDDTLMLQQDGIQSAILHCKRSFNSRDSSIGLCEEGSGHTLRNSFEDEQMTKV